MGFGHMRILACIGQLPESGLMHYGSVGFFFGTDGALRLLAKKPDGGICDIRYVGIPAARYPLVAGNINYT